MPHTARIGMLIGPGDPFWVQVREVMWQRAQLLSVELVEVAIEQSELVSEHARAEIIEDLMVQEFDALMSNTFSMPLLPIILDQHIPVIYIPETRIRHPLLTSRTGLYDSAFMLGSAFAQRLASSTLLVVGGFAGEDDDGTSRITGFYAALPQDVVDRAHYVPCQWSPEDAYQRVVEYLNQHDDLHIDAIFGLSDPIALAAREACAALGRLAHEALILGINGDPLALAAIADGSMIATVETDMDDIAVQSVELACRAARGELLPAHFQARQRLITADTIAEVALRKMISLAHLPTHLVGVNRRNEQQRVTQLETSLAINRQVGSILDKHELSLAITGLIRDNYGFDHARFLLWNRETEYLIVVGDAQRSDQHVGIRPESSGSLAYALERDQTVFIPNVYASHRFAADPLWPTTRARVVVPVHLGGQIVGLLDLHSHRIAHYTREQLDGLQLLADQLGISMRNAELYGEALEARAVAEKADHLKTRLLANVSHELRTPLNVILGYSRTSIDALSNGKVIKPAELEHDLSQVYRSGEHLLRLINDLLDLSRAEIGELDLLLERIDTRAFVADIFRASADLFGVSGEVAWHLDLPPELPMIEADPVRLRQVLLNLLHNAHKFTQQGEITLGAEVAPPHIHIWVADTGSGVSDDLHEQIFEPFVSVDTGVRRHEGIGLGLSITRRLVALHNGSLSLESRLDQGSTFHVYMPLPVLSVLPIALGADDKRTLLLIADKDELPLELVQLAERRNLTLRHVYPEDDLTDLLATTYPALLSWDMAEAMSNGADFVQQIRTHPQLSRLPIILYHPEDARLSEIDTTVVASLATSLLLKPISEHALIEAMIDLDPRESEGSILIIEDDPYVRDLHRRIITQHFPDFHIHEVDDGRSALDVLARETPSLIVLDLILPDIDGFAVLETLRASSRTATVPVLVLSGLTLSANDVRRLGEARVIFQTKDVLTEGELTTSLRRTLTRNDVLPPHTSALVKQAIAFMQQHHSEPLARQDIAEAIGVSKDYLGRIFHQELGLSPWEYLIRYRVLRAKELLLTTGYTISEVATRAGFDSATYFSHIFHREVGCSPRAFRSAQNGGK